MGLCGSVVSSLDGLTPAEKNQHAKEERRMNKCIQKQQDKDEEEEYEILKLLLLGPGESGKSTLFKQLIQLYGKGFNDNTRRPYIAIIYTNIIISMKILIKYSKTIKGCAVAPDIVHACRKLVNEVKNDQEVDSEIANLIEVIWADAGIKNTYKNRSQFQLAEACEYYFRNIQVIGKDDYLPSYNDVLRVRARTTGIVETTFVSQGRRFRLLDVGGQRSERKKWYHCFEDVTCVIFVAALSEYDQVLYEDGRTNRLHESLELFGEICNSRFFTKTSMILFLNKRDLFEEKIKTIDLKCCFEDYEFGCNYNEACIYIKDSFLTMNDHPNSKEVYSHVTCATDTANIEFTFNACKNIILKNGLKDCGLIR